MQVKLIRSSKSIACGCFCWHPTYSTHVVVIYTHEVRITSLYCIYNVISYSNFVEWFIQLRLRMDSQRRFISHLSAWIIKSTTRSLTNVNNLIYETMRQTEPRLSSGFNTLLYRLLFSKTPFFHMYYTFCEAVLETSCINWPQFVNAWFNSIIWFEVFQKSTVY